MKHALLLVIFVNLFIILIPAQTTPTKTPAKTQPQKPPIKPSQRKVKETTIQKAVTLDGKSVILKSNGTWEFAPLEFSEQPKAKTCDLTLKDVPVIRSLKLGMTKEEVQTAFGVNANDKASPFYYSGPKVMPNEVLHYTFYDSILNKLNGFSGIRVLELDFFENELHSIAVKYSESAGNFTREQFRLKLSESFNLPVEVWLSRPSLMLGSDFSPGFETLECREFQIEIVYDNQFTLTNLLTSKKIEASEKSKRNTFKP